MIVIVLVIIIVIVIIKSIIRHCKEKKIALLDTIRHKLETSKGTTPNTEVYNIFTLFYKFNYQF